MFKSRVIAILLATFSAGLFYNNAFPCDVAVVSARVSSTGRPFIWKNRDCSASWHQEIKYFEPVSTRTGGYLMVCAFDDTADFNNGTPVNPSGGVNEAGFAISCTSVYEELVPLHEAVNINTDLIRHALQECVTISDLDKLFKGFSARHVGKVISGNFVAIDAYGGAALYEAYTGMILGMVRPVQYRKYDANNGKVTEFNGLFTFTKTPSQGDSFIGFVNRANSNTYIPYNYGEERRWRAEEILTDLANTGRLNHQNCMIEVAKDVNGQQLDANGNQIDPNTVLDNYSTTYCISRAATRLGMVVDGVASGSDPRLSVFWCVLGEPSAGIFIPYFAHARSTSWLSWIDDIELDGTRYDLNDTSLLARACNRREIYENLLYDDNLGDYLSGMYDKKINKLELAKVQEWTFPLENYLVQRCEEVMSDMTLHPSYITPENLRGFSDYCAWYAYMNYNEGTDDYYAWEYAKPWDPVWTGTTRGGLDDDGGYSSSLPFTGYSSTTNMSLFGLIFTVLGML
ncbi:MAG: hypothetical protein JW807_02545 [Spirochaetes bacterium]|nr:hypothetical protein [Spirochaetota bacterium]